MNFIFCDFVSRICQIKKNHLKMNVFNEQKYHSDPKQGHSTSFRAHTTPKKQKEHSFCDIFFVDIAPPHLTPLDSRSSCNGNLLLNDSIHTKTQWLNCTAFLFKRTTKPLVPCGLNFHEGKEPRDKFFSSPPGKRPLRSCSEHIFELLCLDIIRA